MSLLLYWNTKVNDKSVSLYLQTFGCVLFPRNVITNLVLDIDNDSCHLRRFLYPVFDKKVPVRKVRQINGSKYSEMLRVWNLKSCIDSSGQCFSMTLGATAS